MRAIHIRHLARQLSVEVKGSGSGGGDRALPETGLLEDGQFGNAIRAPLGVHRAANRRYWFYGAPYELDAQMAYLRESAPGD